MAERFAKVKEQEIRELLDNTTSIWTYRISIVYELLSNSALRASLALSSYTTRAYGIIVMLNSLRFNEIWDKMQLIEAWRGK